jgi:hypothetical protein
MILLAINVAVLDEHASLTCLENNAALSSHAAAIGASGPTHRRDLRRYGGVPIVVPPTLDTAPAPTPDQSDVEED